MLDIDQKSIESSPTHNLTESELDMLLLKIGAFLSIISNKKVNQAKLLITVVQNKYFGELCLTLTDIDNTQLLVKNILDRYPTVCKSKLVINALVK